jgi:hypothetical protein
LQLKTYLLSGILTAAASMMLSPDASSSADRAITYMQLQAGPEDQDIDQVMMMNTHLINQP